MPEISRFLGIIITMYFNEHAPAHFHAKYGENKATFCIKTLQLLEGNLPPRIKGYVVEWGSIYQKELQENWEMLTNKNNVSFKKINPLV